MTIGYLGIKNGLPNDAEIKKLFGGAPQLIQHDVARSATRAGGKVVLRRARELAPRGNPDDRRKRSASQKASANWNIKLRTTIAMVSRGSGIRGFVIVGPKHPQGNKAYFNQPRSGSRPHVLWGKRTGRTYRVTRVWIVQAFDETRPQQLAAMKTDMKRKIHEMLT